MKFGEIGEIKVIDSKAYKLVEGNPEWGACQNCVADGHAEEDAALCLKLGLSCLATEDAVWEEVNGQE